MTNHEADMLSLFVSNEDDSFTLLKFGHILIYPNQKLQIPNFHGAQSSKCDINKNQIW